MSADSGHLISQAQKILELSQGLLARVRARLAMSTESCKMSKTLRSQAREIRAETRNYRQIALLRRVLYQKHGARGAFPHPAAIKLDSSA